MGCANYIKLMNVPGYNSHLSQSQIKTPHQGEIEKCIIHQAVVQVHICNNNTTSMVPEPDAYINYIASSALTILSLSAIYVCIIDRIQS